MGELNFFHIITSAFDIKMLYGARYCFPKYMRMKPIQNYNVHKCTFQGWYN